MRIAAASVSGLLKGLARSMGFVITVVLVLAGLPYLGSEIHTFPAPRPFQGEFIHNPYDSLPAPVLRANFHAHAKAWGGFTSGEATEDSILAVYHAHGYTIAGISNYHRMSEVVEEAPYLYVPIYEHGYNLGKAHCLGIAPKRVSHMDFPLFQLSSHQQSIIDRMRANKAHIVLAHPQVGFGRTLRNMRDLVGYHYMEILNPYGASVAYYDEALSAGRLSWVMGNDDCHDLRPQSLFRRWNMIFTDASDVRSMLDAYDRGHNYAVFNFDNTFPKQFKNLTREGPDSFTCRFTAPFDSILVIGQGGRIKQFVRNADTLRFSFAREDTYLRVVAKDKDLHLYLNPLVRYDGQSLPLAASMRSEIDKPLTWCFRVFTFVLLVGMVMLLRSLIRPWMRNAKDPFRSRA
jgi:hypothetical protein